MMLSSNNLDTKVIGDKYILLNKKQIGVGGFAYVFEGFVKGNPQERVAIKILQRNSGKQTDQCLEKIKTAFKRETEIQKSIVSRHVVRMIDVVMCNQSTYLILDLCEEGNLNKLMTKQPKRQLNQNRAFQIFCQIAEGYKSLYHLKALHRDLKPENILFSRGVAKIADFGLAKIIEEMDLAADQTNVGSMLYQAPEMMIGEKYSSKVDIWALGVIFYEMLYGQTPFLENNLTRLYKKITTEPIKFPQDVKIDQQYIDLIIKMLKVDPEKRIRWDDLFTYLSKEQENQIMENENLSIASTHMSDSDRFQSQYKKIEEKVNKIDEIQNYFGFVQKLIEFSNNQVLRLFFSLKQEHQLSQAKQLLFSVTTIKYIINDINFNIKILLGDIPPSEINLKENDIKTFQSNEAKYYKTLNSLKTLHEQMNKYYNQVLIQQYDKYKQCNQESQLIQIVEEVVQANSNTKKLKDCFNKAYLICIEEIKKSIKKNQITNEATLRSIYTLLIYMYNSIHPQKFIQKKFEPKDLEQEIINSTTQKLENQLFDISLCYNGLIQ